jgi:hypothetical protein
MFFLLRLLIHMVAILIIAYLLPNVIRVDGLLAALVAAVEKRSSPSRRRKHLDGDQPTRPKSLNPSGLWQLLQGQKNLFYIYEGR